MNKIKVWLLIIFILKISIYANIGGGLDESSHLNYLTLISQKMSLVEGHYYSKDPPGYYVLGAIIYKIFYPLKFSIESLRILSIILATISISYTFKSIDLLTKNNNERLISYIIAVFHPTFAINASRISNDILLIFCTSSLLYYLIKYFKIKELNTKNKIIIGIIFGVGLISKQQFMGFTLLLITYFLIRAKLNKQYFIELLNIIIIFIISSVISGGFYIRNYIKYDKFIPFRANNELTYNTIDLLYGFAKHLYTDFFIIKNDIVHHFGNLGIDQIYTNNFIYYSLFIIYVFASIKFLFFLYKFKEDKYKKIWYYLLLFIIFINILGLMYSDYMYKLYGDGIRMVRSGLFNHLITAEAIIIGISLYNLTKNKRLIWINNLTSLSFAIFLILTDLVILLYYYIPYYYLGVNFR